jgi:hypothetical protein
VEVTAERRAQLSAAGKRGGRQRWIVHPEPGDILAKAQKTFRLSFLTGHSCASCKAVTVIDPTWPDATKRKAAERARRNHYRELALLSAKKRASQ